MPLFERSRSGVRATSAGEQFLREAAIGAEHLSQAVRELTLAKKGHAGKLRLGLMASLASGFLPDLLGAYHRRFPAIELKLEEATAQVSACAVMNGRLDAAFLPGYPVLPGCEARRLWDEKIYVAVPASHRRASAEGVTWGDIKDDLFLVTADAAGPEIRNFLVRQLSGHGFHPEISVQRIGRDNLLNMVARGFGITLTTESTFGMEHAGIRYLSLLSPENRVSSCIVWSHSNRNPALKNLIELGLELAAAIKN